ncbi:hypothetical protein X975_24064, partial [Stegodyphus mimosarum]
MLVDYLTSELTTVCYALLYISKLCQKKFIIYIDSYSALKTLKAFSGTKHPVVIEVLKLNSNLQMHGNQTLYCWVPGHVGVKGKELTDISFKSAVYLCSQHMFHLWISRRSSRKKS